jgi:hypothetical protein
MAAAAYLYERFSQAGLADLHTDDFHFPRHVVRRSLFEVRVGPHRVPIAAEVLEASAPCEIEGEVVWTGRADEESLRGRDVRGKLCLVERNPLYHRSTQCQNLAVARAAAAIVVSTAPDNLRQVGSLRRLWESVSDLPAVSIGAHDGRALKLALESHQRVRARLSVEVAVDQGAGQNVLGVIPGWEPRQIVIGAHYDSWFAGASDNGGGVAALLALAERRAGRMRPRYTLTFVAWDGEELALYGGYEHLRRRSQDPERVLAVIGLETPSARGAQASALACSAHAPLSHALEVTSLSDLFSASLPMELVPELFGGVIPTDIQGHYRAGFPVVATAVDAPYYHTIGDTPDKVDLDRLDAIVGGFDHYIDRLLAEPAARFFEREPGLWHIDLGARTEGGTLFVDALVRDGSGRPRPMAAVPGSILYDHFFELERRSGVTDESGRITLAFSAVDLAVHSPPRLLHVSAGLRYPLAEALISID